MSCTCIEIIHIFSQGVTTVVYIDTLQYIHNELTGFRLRHLGTVFLKSRQLASKKVQDM